MGQKKYPDELRERATRMTLDALADPARAKGAIGRIADELGVHPEALRTWVKKAQVDGGLRPDTTTVAAQLVGDPADRALGPRRVSQRVQRHPLGPDTTTEGHRLIKELEKEVRELRRANAILKSASSRVPAAAAPGRGGCRAGCPGRPGPS